MKIFFDNALLALLLLSAGVAMAQTQVTLPGVCATCPTIPSPVQGEPTPCNGLLNARDFSAVGANYENIVGNPVNTYSGFISREGRVYVGWYVSQLSPGTDVEPCLTGQTRSTATTLAYASNRQNMFTAYPAQNVLADAPGQTFKAIQKVRGLFFILSDQGKIYNWGGSDGSSLPLDAIAGPAGQTTLGNSECSVLHKLREVPHPESKKWVSMHITNEVAYAGDEAGQWWCWGYGRKSHMPSSAIGLPTTSQTILQKADAQIWTPVRMDLLPVQPLLTNEDDEQTLAGGTRGIFTGVGTTNFLSYIGSDSLVYTYTYDYAQWLNASNNLDATFIRSRFTKVKLPVGVKAKKLQRGFVPSKKQIGGNPNSGNTYGVPIDYILATDGNIYKFIENDSVTTKLDLGTYKFQNFIVRNPRERVDNTIPFNAALSTDFAYHGLDLVVQGGAPFISTVKSTTAATAYDMIVYGPAQGINFKVSKLWNWKLGDGNGGSYGATILKSADTNHSYLLDGCADFFNRPTTTPFGSFMVNTGSPTMGLATGVEWTFRSDNPNLYGPYKLINCQN
ncbi:hypothetical protein [Arsenicibacter rosenii]|uniref:PKD domain-containing protein n=1 Tax=Arsenicibacter rosenii TaxID=1750698 RepID=A0A1S2VJ22_9BACT|nr:hypothetical protein [Arsenicibacter rosenii]OIN58754.1 hypothetical protein BLX24_14465 [Arsenicibacter rosenii]